MTRKRDLSTGRRRISIVLDPRFPGGTSAAVARELHALSQVADLRVFAIETAMFRGNGVNPSLSAALDELGLRIHWKPDLIRDEIVVLHNPACLKFDRNPIARIVCDQFYVVAHENFLRPAGGEGFDVGLCLSLIDQALLARAKFLAPVSGYNRRNIQTWLELNPEFYSWEVAANDWFNICDFELLPASSNPRDRRGRISRPGLEKFPPLEVMLSHFPPHAEACVILGGDSLLLDPASCPRHWKVHPFGSVSVREFLMEFDFFVYFTHPNLRESFGRVVAEAIAAGKVVITDAGIAETFGEVVMVARNPGDVDQIISRFISNPDHYREFVRRAQGTLVAFSAEAFRTSIFSNFDARERKAI